jgi:hypothetical protein
MQALIKTMKMAKREKTARGLSFVEMDEIGHADLLDCLIYLIRNVNRHAMPVADPQAHVARDWTPKPQGRSQAGETLRMALGRGAARTSRRANRRTRPGPARQKAPCTPQWRVRPSPTAAMAPLS